MWLTFLPIIGTYHICDNQQFGWLSHVDFPRRYNISCDRFIRVQWLS